MRTQDKVRQNVRPSTSKIWRFNSVAAAVAIALGGFAAVPGQAFAAAPNAGDNIGNIASADYTDATATPRTAFSNPVNTTVRQVASFTLIDNRTAFVTPGGQVVYSHTLTNTGNGNDTFLLSVANVATGDDFNLNNVAIYRDSNSDGVPDDATDLNGSTIALPRNGVFDFVVVATAPTSALNGQISDVLVTADSQVFEAGGGGNVDPADVTNTDRATVTADAVIGVSKSANVISGPTGTVIEYTLTYRNTGNNTATGVTISDIVPDPYAGATAGFDYEVGTGLWSNAPSTALTDADDTGVDPAGIAYKYDSGTKTVTAVIASVAPNVTGTIKFQVKVGSTTPPGVVPNVAQYSYDANGPTAGGNIGPLNSNTQNFTVTQTVAVAANDSTTISAITGDDDIVDAVDAAGNPINASNPANPSDVVVFSNEIWNNGNGTDTFNIGVSNSASFPAGTTFALFKSDGVTPLVTTDADSTADTGPLAAGGRYTVVVKATLPSTVTIGTTAPFSLTLTATSTTNGLVADTVTDRVTHFANATVDITNDAAAGNPGALGGGAGTNTALHTTAVNPGSSATFSIFVKNTSGIVDNYNLQSASDSAFTTGFPAGWNVTYYAGAACSGTAVVNTGNIAAGASAQFCALVTTPTGAAPGTTNVFLRAVSAVSGASDYKVDAVTINTIHDVAIDTIGANQVAPNGTVNYTHRLTNLGNVTDDVSVTAASANLIPANQFPVALYYDANNNNVIDGGEGIVPASFTLAPGASVNLIAQVTGPAGATDGQQDTTNLVATLIGFADADTNNNATTDVTTVRYGQVRLVKEQALDADCNGTEDGAFTQAVMSAKPAECIVYRITARNEGSQAVTGVVLYDAIPTYTTLQVPSLPAVSGTAAGPFTFGPSSPSTDGAVGTLTVNVGAMNGGETAILKFGVQVDN